MLAVCLFIAVLWRQGEQWLILTWGKQRRHRGSAGHVLEDKILTAEPGEPSPPIDRQHQESHTGMNDHDVWEGQVWMGPGVQGFCEQRGSGQRGAEGGQPGWGWPWKSYAHRQTSFWAKGEGSDAFYYTYLLLAEQWDSLRFSPYILSHFWFWDTDHQVTEMLCG